MDNGRPNERTWWSSRLEEPGALPGAGLTDKEATWDKLYDRLRETPRRRTLPWLWVAAASLLLALVPAAFLLKEKRTITQPQPLTRPDQPTAYPAPDKNPAAVAQSTLPVSPSAGPPTHIPLHPARRERRTLLKQPIQTLAPVFSKASSASRQTLPELLPPPRPDLSKPLSLATIQQAKPEKELKVIHINELEPLQPTPSMTGVRLRPGRLHLSFSQQETFRPTTTYNNSYPVDHPIIPLKLSQNP